MKSEMKLGRNISWNFNYGILAVIIFLFFGSTLCIGQQVPSSFENIDQLTTFSKESPNTKGNDNKIQIYFFSIPESYKGLVHIRVYDPDLGGDLDISTGKFNSKTKFTIYGGKGAYSDPAARKAKILPGYDNGTVLDSKTFGSENTNNNKWVSFGPFNAKEGEKDGNAFMFKIIIEGQEGDDGNGYKLACSSVDDKNENIEGAGTFAYKISFRLKSKPGEVAHFYPFVDDKVVSIKQVNFDFDNDGEMRLTTVAKNQHALKPSGEGTWASSTHAIEKAEYNTSVDIQIIKKSNKVNDMVIYFENQYGEAIPFHSIPLNGIPKYKYKVKVKID